MGGHTRGQGRGVVTGVVANKLVVQPRHLLRHLRAAVATWSNSVTQGLVLGLALDLGEQSFSLPEAMPRSSLSRVFIFVVAARKLGILLVA